MMMWLTRSSAAALSFSKVNSAQAQERTSWCSFDFKAPRSLVFEALTRPELLKDALRAEGDEVELLS